MDPQNQVAIIVLLPVRRNRVVRTVTAIITTNAETENSAQRSNFRSTVALISHRMGTIRVARTKNKEAPPA